MSQHKLAENELKATDKSPKSAIDFKKILVIAGIGFIGGIIWFATIRFILIKPVETHYHANFLVSINGQREMFSDPSYYEEIAACSADYANNPKGRIHMHDKVNDVIHVHAQPVTYGNFFQNIGWSVGDEFIADRKNVYQSNTSNKVIYVLNGEEVDNIANRLVSSTDRLLVYYGPENDEVNKQFDSVASTAAEVNNQPDPAACGGASNENGFIARLKRATFWN